MLRGAALSLALGGMVAMPMLPALAQEATSMPDEGPAPDTQTAVNPVDGQASAGADATGDAATGPDASDAQTGSVATVPFPGSSVCLANTLKGGAVAGRAISIAVPADKAQEFRERGFADTTCARVKQFDKSGLCRIADARDSAVNAWFWATYGFTAEEICTQIDVADS